MAWHYLLKHETSINQDFEEYIWIQSRIPNIRQNAIGAMCRRIIKRNKSDIPYGLLYKGNSSFTQEGIFTIAEEENGLTCATFVLAVFSACGINLIDLSSWPNRKEDKIWHGHIINSLKRSSQSFNITDDHIKNVENEVGCARYKPEEVGVSSIFENLPVSFLEIESKAVELRELLNK